MKEVRRNGKRSVNVKFDDARERALSPPDFNLRFTQLGEMIGSDQSNGRSAVIAACDYTGIVYTVKV